LTWGRGTSDKAYLLMNKILSIFEIIFSSNDYPNNVSLAVGDMPVYENEA
jgi:hypothetical protein